MVEVVVVVVVVGGSGCSKSICTANTYLVVVVVLVDTLEGDSSVGLNSSIFNPRLFRKTLLLKFPIKLGKVR